MTGNAFQTLGDCQAKAPTIRVHRIGWPRHIEYRTNAAHSSRCVTWSDELPQAKRSSLRTWAEPPQRRRGSPGIRRAGSQRLSAMWHSPGRLMPEGARAAGCGR